MSPRGIARRLQHWRVLQLVVAATLALGLAPSLAPAAEAVGGQRTIRLPRTSVVSFTVDRDWSDFEVRFHTARTGRYSAVYLPATNSGWVHVVDPSGQHRGSITLPFGELEWPSFTKGHKYSMFVVLDRAGRLTLPPYFRVLGFHPRGIPAGFAVESLPVPPNGGTIADGWMRSPIGAADLSVAAIAVDFRVPPQHVTSGNACTATTPASTCLEDDGKDFTTTQVNPWHEGWRAVRGRSYTTRQTDPFVDGTFQVLQGEPFEAANLVAFGLGPINQ
jgi:hypothetical protein